MQSSAALLVAILAGSTCAYQSFTLSSQTWYGWPDNCENGYNEDCGNADTAYSCVGRNYVAGGDGSYDNPLTYATSTSSPLHNQCEVTWFPYLEKYLVMSDICTGCDDDQIDVWISNDHGSTGSAEIDCENNSPSGNGHVLIRYGSSGHTPNTNELWSTEYGCQVSENVYPNAP